MARLRRLLPVVLALVAWTSGAGAQETRRIVVVPPLQWDSPMGTFRSAYRQSPADLGPLTGGILFGMKPNEVNALLPEPQSGLVWNALPLANEYPEDVRYFWMRLSRAGGLTGGTTACLGQGSYVAFLFRSRGLFRISFRLIPDNTCPSVEVAARDILAHYAVLGQDIVQSRHYRFGGLDVVDITDPGAGHLGTIRLQQRRR